MQPPNIPPPPPSSSHTAEPPHPFSSPIPDPHHNHDTFPHIFSDGDEDDDHQHHLHHAHHHLQHHAHHHHSLPNLTSPSSPPPPPRTHHHHPAQAPSQHQNRQQSARTLPSEVRKMQIKAIFFAVFHPREGPQVVAQVPDFTITSLPPSTTSPFPARPTSRTCSHHPEPPAQTNPLIDFDAISSLLIPSQSLCDRLLTIVSSPPTSPTNGTPHLKYRVLSYPVCLVDPTRYDRNEFIFNFGLVLDEDAEFSTYKSVVRKLAKLFKALEEQCGFLSREAGLLGGEEGGEDEGPGGRIYGLIEQVLEDLNNYSECMIPIDESNTINIKLFPTYSPPAPILPHHVPILTLTLPSPPPSHWDLTLQRILPFIDSLNSVHRISELSCCDPHLTRRALSHLLYYGALILADVFTFSSVYAPTAEISSFLTEPGMAEECISYICPGSPDGSGCGETGGKGGKLGKVEVFSLYAGMGQGVSVKKFCMGKGGRLRGIDVRRFVGFGVVKGLLYRVHRWPVGDGEMLEAKVEARGGGVVGERIAKCVKQGKCVDEICTELGMSVREVEEVLSTMEVVVISR